MNQTKLSFLSNGGQDKLPETPSTPFPYPRIATTTTINNRAFYVYHQLNETTMAQEVWDPNSPNWSSVYIDVAVS